MVINLFAVCKLLGPTLNALAFVALIPTLYAFFSETLGADSFLIMSVIFLVSGKLLTCIGNFGKRHYSNFHMMLTIRELFLFTSSMWFIIAIISAFPIFMLLPDVDYCGAFFETASGLSTTGATCINHLDTRPPALLLWRSILQLFGGIGFVVVAVAVLPQVAMGGMNIFKTESTYFESSSKFTPHMKTMSLAILGWYLITLILCTISLLIGGLDPFLAINAAMCTVASGGMMPVDASMNGMSPFVHYSTSFFMFIASCPFTVVIAGLGGDIRKLVTDQQVRGYFIFTMTVALGVATTLYLKNNYDIERAFRIALFNVISILSSTGFNLGDFTQWNPIATLIFLIILPIGGCAGSTSGGLKFFRLQVCASLLRTQLIKSIHPHRVISPQFNGHPLDVATVNSIITFIAAYFIMALISSFIATSFGLNISDAITATLTCLSNIGPALGPSLGPSNNFSGLSDGIYLLFAFDMLLGRLEIIPVLLCLTRMFWRN